MKGFILFTAFITTSTDALAADYSTPKAHCLKAAEAVKQNDVALLKPLVWDLTPEEEETMAPYLAKIHRFYTQTAYKGIHNFRIDNVKLIENARTSIYQRTRKNAARFNYDQEVWVNYTFDSQYRDVAQGQTRGQCKFAFIDERWVMVNVLK